MSPILPHTYTLELASPLDLVPASPAALSGPSSSDLQAALPLFSQATYDGVHHMGKRGGVGNQLGESGLHLSRRAISLAPDPTQKITIGVIGAYTVVIAILWNIPVLNKVLYPFKMLTIAFHEFGHAATGACTGASIKSISLDPHEGGVTKMAGGISAITLPAGYLGSSLIGALLIFCGFDIVASKVASFVLGLGFLATLWWGRRDWLTILTILFAVGLLVAFWFIAHAAPLRFFVLFMGTMSSLYSVWDICDDLILRKVNESDASVFAKRYGGSSACWGVIWGTVSLVFMAAGIIGGLAAFKDDFATQAAKSAQFIPTRW